jgi:hypothetical protein
MVVQTIIRGSGGHWLRTPLTVDIPEPVDEVERGLQQYIISSCTSRMPRLVNFVFENASVVELCKHLKNWRSASELCLFGYVCSLYYFSKWLKTSLDELVNECKDPDGYAKPKAVVQVRQRLDNYLAYLRNKDLAYNTINNNIRAIDCLFRSNDVELNLNFCLPRVNSYEVRAIAREELQRLLVVADLREKVIVTLSALSGFRLCTISRLRYYHVKADLEKGVVPVHLYIEAEINKGKYQSYETFLNHETVKYLKTYLDVRRVGTRRLPPETIVDESPLVRSQIGRKPVTSHNMQTIIHSLYVRAGLIQENNRLIKHVLKTTSLRKFFRSQMSLLGVDREYTEFMMGHRTNSYHDMKMRGVEYLRRVYQSSGISIEPAVPMNNLDVLKDIIREMGLNPEKILRHKLIDEQSVPK